MDPGATSLSNVVVPVRSRVRDGLRLVMVGLGISVVPLDTAVNIAFPDITGSFGLPLAMIQWVIICYVLTHAGLMLACGRAGDIWSHGRVFRAGLAWSTAAFLLCAAAPSFGWLLFFRFLQGIGAGLIISCAPAVVTSLYPETRRAHALGIFTLMFALGSAVGPLIGGALVARWGWPAVFWFRAPIALVALMLVHGLPAGGAGRGQRFDIAGALLLALGIAALLLAINTLPRLGDGNYLGLLQIAVAAASLAGFVRWEGGIAQPIVQIALFRNRAFAAINLAGVLMYLTTFSVLLIGPYFLVRHTTLPLPVAGALLATGFVAMATVSPVAGWLIGRFPAERVAPLGALIGGLGLFLVGEWRPDTPPQLMLVGLVLQGVGSGLFQVSYMEIVMATAPAAHRGVAGSLSMLTRTIGVVTAAAGLTLAFQTLQSAALAQGGTEMPAFLSAFRTLFHGVGIAAMLAGAMIGWVARRR